MRYLIWLLVGIVGFTACSAGALGAGGVWIVLGLVLFTVGMIGGRRAQQQAEEDRLVRRLRDQ